VVEGAVGVLLVVGVAEPEEEVTVEDVAEVVVGTGVE